MCGRRGSAPCEACWRLLRPAPPAPPPPGLDACRSLLLYDGAARELVARLKYRNARSAVAWLAGAMAGLLPDPLPVDTVITWAPTSAERRRARGFDQAEVLATAVGRELDMPVVRALERLTSAPQTGRAAFERARGVSFASRTAAVAGRAAVLVDDVITTGATLSAAARALHNGGATSVIGLTTARTPLKLAK